MNCQHKSSGFASRKIKARCYLCNRYILPFDVLVPFGRKEDRETSNVHSCAACDDLPANAKGKNNCPVYNKIVIASKPVK